MNVLIWSKPSCQFCDMAKNLLKSKNIEYEERNIGTDYTKEDLLEMVPMARTVPQIFVDNEYVGGYQELKKYMDMKLIQES